MESERNSNKIPAPSKTNTAAIIVLHEPDDATSNTLATLIGEVKTIILVCNDQQSSKRIAALKANNIVWIQNSRNLGLAYGLNKGIATARSLNFQWVLLLDQDTLIYSNFVSSMSAVYSSFSDREPLGMIVANYQASIGGPIAYPTSGTGTIVNSAVTSGSLIPIAVTELVGDMIAAFFIEGIDTEFCLRIRSHGFKIIATSSVLMAHSAGDYSIKRFFGRPVAFSSHAPWRLYLQARNLSWIIRKYWCFDSKWAMRSMIGLAKKSLLVTIYSRNRTESISAIIAGISDSIAMIDAVSWPHVPQCTSQRGILLNI